jgi:hypothetical protein
MTTSSRTQNPSTDHGAHKDLVLRGPAVAVVAALIVAMAQLLPVGPARALVTIPVVLLVPGWAAYLAVFGRSRPDDRVVGATFTVALGMGVAILSGLVVNTIGWRLSEGTLVFGPAVVALVLFGLAEFRGADTSLRIPATVRPPIASTAIVLCCSLSLGVIAVAYAADRLPAPDPGAPFAELSFAPAFARAAQPLPVAAGEQVLLPLEMRLTGLDHVTYRVFTFVDGARVASRHATVSAPIWEGDVKIAAPHGRCLHQVQIFFVPTNARGVKLVWLDTYLAVTTGSRCRS